jgi:16S rRNA (guanine527-N7)-methyltransferase
LTNTQAVHGRAEEAGHQPQHREQYDVVIARAVAPLPTLVEYLLPLARVGGLCICMKGSDAQSEAAQAAGAIAKLGGALKRIDSVAIPGREDKRALILIDKTRPTPKLYPRQAGAPRKTPLQ